MIRIDGSTGSGSGSIVRVGLVLSALTGEAIQIHNIRSRRPKSGLRHQHVKIIEAVVEMTRADCSGAAVGSDFLEFTPALPPQGGSYRWDIGTAGSATMLAGTLLMVAAFANRKVDMLVEGGVFQDFAPSGYHLQYCLVPLLRAMGVRIEFEMLRPGYVPRGGGRLQLSVVPVEGCLMPIVRTRQVVRKVWGIALSSHLERARVSERMAESCMDVLVRRGFDPDFRIVEDHIAPQPGAACALFAEGEDKLVLCADMAGAPGRRSEVIGRRVAGMLLQDLATGATVDRHLADQIILPAALASGCSQFVVPSVTDHVSTVSWLVQEFLEVELQEHQRRFRIEGAGWTRREHMGSAS